jgi:excisionase family DNA binding protein
MTAPENTARTNLTPLLVTVRGAAKMLALGESTIYEMIASGELPYVPVGRAKRVALRDLEAWVESRKARAA